MDGAAAPSRLPERDNRSNPRVIERKTSRLKLKREKHRHRPQPSKPFQEAIVILNRTVLILTRTSRNKNETGFSPPRHKIKTKKLGAFVSLW
jgi:hypothetical protein